MDLVLNGYIRKINPMIPKEIIKLSTNYFNDVIYWTITKKNKNDKEFYTKKYGEYIKNKPFIIKDISFNNVLYPVGFDRALQRDHCLYLVQLTDEQMPENIDNIIIYYCLYCDKIDIQVRNFFVLKANKSNSMFYKML